MTKTKIALFFPLIALIIGCSQQPEQPLSPTTQNPTVIEEVSTSVAPSVIEVPEVQPVVENLQESTEFVVIPAAEPSAVIEPTKTTSPGESRGIATWDLMIESMGEGYLDYKEGEGDDVRLEQADKLSVNAYLSNMQSGDVIRQDWYFNGELLGSSDIQWDFETYGEEGWWREATTADFEDETQQGVYELKLYLNGDLNGEMAATISPATFNIDPIVEPSSGKKARMLSPNEFAIENPDQGAQVFQVDGRVSSINWFPDGDRLLVTTKHVVERGCFIFPPFCMASQMEIVDLATGTIQKVSTLEDDFHSPVLSPDGRYAAVLTGAGYGDACSTGLGFKIIEISDNGEVGEFKLNQFTENGLPFDNQFMQGEPRDSQAKPWHWVDPSMLEAGIHFSDCSDRYGIYQFDLANMTIEKVE